MNSFLLDTNIFSIFFSRSPAPKLLNSIEKTLSSSHVFISGITYYEIKRGLLSIDSTNGLKLFENLSKVFHVIWLDDRRIFDEAAIIYSNLRKSGNLISDADIFIASIARVHNLILVSEDTDFKKIEHLNFIKLDQWLKE